MSFSLIAAVFGPRAGNRRPGRAFGAGGLLAAAFLLAAGLASWPALAQEPRLAAPTVETSATEETRALAEGLFSALEAGDTEPLIAHLADEVRWTITGGSTLSGIYDGKKAFLDGPYRRLAGLLKEPMHARVQRILADGDAVAVQWLGSGTTQNGSAFSNEYCWIVRFEGERIVEVTSYFDGARVDKLLAGGR